MKTAPASSRGSVNSSTTIPARISPSAPSAGSRGRRAATLKRISSAAGIATPQRAWSNVGMPLMTTPTASAAAAKSGALRRQISGSVTAPITRLSTIVPSPLAGSSVIAIPSAVKAAASAQSSHGRGTGSMTAIVTPCRAADIILASDSGVPPREDVALDGSR